MAASEPGKGLARNYAGYLLIVDDEKAVRELLSEFLTPLNFVCKSCSDGKDTLRQLGLIRADLVISDIRMPGMTGLELLRTIRQQFPDVGVVLLTAFGQVDLATECMKAGALDFITKPIDLKKLPATIMKALEKRQALLDQRSHSAKLEHLVQQRTTELEQRVAELAAINRLFRQHLSQKSQSEEKYAQMAQQLRSLIDHLNGLSEFKQLKGLLVESPDATSPPKPASGTGKDVGDCGNLPGGSGRESNPPPRS